MNGLERNWSVRDTTSSITDPQFDDVVLKDDGEVISVRFSLLTFQADRIQDNGDLKPHTHEDELPVGLGPGMDRFLVRGRPESEQTATARDHLQQSAKM